MNESARKPKFRFSLLYLLLAIWMGVAIHDLIVYRTQVETIPYSQFLSDLSSGKIDSVGVTNDRVEGSFKNVANGQPSHFVALRVEDRDLSQKLIQAHVRFEAIRESALWRDLLSWIVPAMIMVGFWWLLMGRIGRAQGQFLSLGKSKAKVYVERDLKTKFNDVAGVDEAKEELQELVQFLKDPRKYNRLGGHMPKGLLLVGPPGTGKTLLARAVAGEAGVPFFSINGSEFVEMFVGLGAARVRDLFEEARRQAPCIIFIDELDALGKARGGAGMSGVSNDEKEQTLNQLLAELDGFDASIGVVLLAATNRPEVLDPALLRSGRFDRQLMIDRPDRRGREAILRIHMKDLKIAADVASESLAGLTAGFSGADLANLANEAALIATRRAAESIGASDFTAAIERIVGGLERRSRVLQPEEKRRVAYHEMGHAVLALDLDKGEAVHKVSVIPRGIGALGYTMRRPIEDRYLMNRDELENKMAILLGGRAAESIFFAEVSTGASDDFDRVTEIARSMVTRYGMSDALGLLTYDHESSPFLDARMMRGHDYSEDTARLIDREIMNLVDRTYHRALRVLRHHRALVEEGVKILLVQETLDEQTLMDLWEKHLHRVPPAPEMHAALLNL